MPAIGRKISESITTVMGVVNAVRTEYFDWSSLAHVPMSGPITVAKDNGIL